MIMLTNTAQVLPNENRQPKLTIIPANPELQKLNRGTRKLRVAAYARVSTELEEQQSSFETQVKYYTDLIMGNKDWTFAGIYADEGISGTLLRKRKDFNRMIRHCKAGKIDMILTKSIPRFARNTVDSIKTIRELKDLGIAVVFERENVNTLLTDNETIIGMHSVMAQAESESISGNVKWGFRRAFAAGKVFYSYGHWYGYIKGADGRPEIVPEQAEVVRGIYGDFLAGRSLGQISDGLNARGITRIKKVKWSSDAIQNLLQENRDGHLQEDEVMQAIRTGNQEGRSHRQIADELNAKGIRRKKVTYWSTSMIQSILKNERYCGDAISQKTFVKDCLTKKAVKNNGELPMFYLQDAHAGIIDRTMWHRAQRELERRASKRKPVVAAGELGASRYSAKFALTELLVCTECGSTYRRRTWKKKNGEKVPMWRCMSRVNYGTQYCKDSPSIEESRLLDALSDAMRRFLWGRDQLEGMMRDNFEIALAAEQGRESLAALQYQRAELEKSTFALTDTLVGTGAADIAACNAQFEALKAQLDIVKGKIDELQNAKNDRESAAEKLEDVNRALEQAPLDLAEYDDGLARLLIDSIHVVDRDHATIHFKDGSEVNVTL